MFCKRQKRPKPLTSAAFAGSYANDDLIRARTHTHTRRHIRLPNQREAPFTRIVSPSRAHVRYAIERRCYICQRSGRRLLGDTRFPVSLFLFPFSRSLESPLPTEYCASLSILRKMHPVKKIPGTIVACHKSRLTPVRYSPDRTIVIGPK